jgi:uncharacterized membrane protein
MPSGPDPDSQRSSSQRSSSPRFSSGALLAALLASAGVLHLTLPKPFDSLIPRWLPGSARSWTYASGVGELAIAALVANPRTRSRGALAAAALFVAVFPGNITMAVNWSDRGWVEQAVAYGRLPLQIPLIVWALRVAEVDVRAAVRERIP